MARPLWKLIARLPCDRQRHRGQGPRGNKDLGSCKIQHALFTATLFVAPKLETPSCPPEGAWLQQQGTLLSHGMGWATDTRDVDEFPVAVPTVVVDTQRHT